MKTNVTAIDLVANLQGAATAITRERYQRISSIYDRMEGLMEQRLRPWREKLWQLACGPRILEVGVGTGKNLEFWPGDCKVTAIDLTPGMLDVAHRRAQALNREADDLFLVDVQHLELPSEGFHTFCTAHGPCVVNRFWIRFVLRNNAG